MTFTREFHGVDLKDAIEQATAGVQKKTGLIESKQITEVYAPPLFWGPWFDIFTQLGVVGRDSARHVTRLDVSFRSITGNSSFDVEIKGGDEKIRVNGPGSTTVTITGNVATTIRMRAKSHSGGLSIDVDVRDSF